jgi:hypothetical protein
VIGRFPRLDGRLPPVKLVPVCVAVFSGAGDAAHDERLHLKNRRLVVERGVK